MIRIGPALPCAARCITTEWKTTVATSLPERLRRRSGSLYASVLLTDQSSDAQ